MRTWNLKKAPLSIPLLPPSLASLPSHFLRPLSHFSIREMLCEAACQFVSLTSQQWVTAERLMLHPSSSVHCLHSWPDNFWPVVTQGWETPVFLDPDPHAFSNKIQPYSRGRGHLWNKWALFWLSQYVLTCCNQLLKILSTLFQGCLEIF